MATAEDEHWRKGNGATSIYLFCWVLESSLISTSSRNPRLDQWLFKVVAFPLTTPVMVVDVEGKPLRRRALWAGPGGGAPREVGPGLSEVDQGLSWWNRWKKAAASKRNASGRRLGRMFGGQTLALGTDVCAAGVVGERKTGNDEAEGGSNGPVSLLPRHLLTIPGYRFTEVLLACLLACLRRVSSTIR
jgi:hypothetical protein